jgi:hypothetical protein
MREVWSDTMPKLPPNVTWASGTKENFYSSANVGVEGKLFTADYLVKTALNCCWPQP